MPYTLLREGRAHRAVCDCGWVSEPMTTPGMAGADWDQHLRREHDAIDLRD